MTNYILWMDFESRMHEYTNEILHVGTMRDMRHYTKEFLSAKELATLVKDEDGTLELGESVYAIEPLKYNTKYISLASAPGAGGEIEYFESIDSFQYPTFIDSDQDEYVGACCIYDTQLKTIIKRIVGKLE
jgi:hypothetical protein